GPTPGGGSGFRAPLLSPILDHTDVAMLIGRGGFTAGAIRSVLNAAAERKGVKVTLRIHSVEEEQQRLAELEAKEIIDDGSNP
ncbi:MAG: hypothetical protein ACKJSK_20365, partial [Roseibacillus sp.]